MLDFLDMLWVMTTMAFMFLVAIVLGAVLVIIPGYWIFVGGRYLFNILLSGSAL